MMKVAEIIPLYKGKEEDHVVNYRPVSLLMTILKVLEKIIYSRLYKFLTKHNLLYDSQYGFRSKHSCEDTILEMVGRLPSCVILQSDGSSEEGGSKWRSNELFKSKNFNM